MAGKMLDGRLALVTGAQTPAGRAVTQRLAAAGADLLPGTGLDPGDLASIDRLADALLDAGRPIDLLVAADEIVAVPHRVDPHGVEAQMSHNALANALLASRLSPLLRAAEAGRFVILGSGAHQIARPDPDDLGFARGGYEPWHAYAASKTAAGLVALKVYREFSEEAYSTAIAAPRCLSAATAPLPAPLAEAPWCDDEGAAAGEALFWAATAPQAFARYSYADGAGPSKMLKAPVGTRGHMPHIGDVDLSERLWAAFERHLGRALDFAPLREVGR